MVIAVRALVLARPVAQVGGRSGRGHRTFADAGDSRGVVGAVDDRGIADVMGAGHEVDLAEEAGMLKVTVGDGAGGVVGRHEAELDLGREGVSPQEALPGVVEVHSTHARLGIKH